MEEPLYAELQRQVQRKLGRCLIRTQQYELLLKEIVAKREVSGILGTNSQVMEASTTPATMTMGQLVGELTGKYFQPTLLESGTVQPDLGPADDEHPAGWARVQMSVSMPPDAHATLTADLQELVDLRNDLVHHFVEGQDLVTVEGCIAADMYLEDCYAEIDRHLTSLQGWAASMNEATRSMASLIASPDYKKLLLAELSPVLSPQAAALPGLVELLRRAEVVKGTDGWTALSAAVNYAKNIEPEETPAKYDFVSWGQVLNDARTFDVRRGRADPDSTTGGTTETWYRSRLNTRH